MPVVGTPIDSEGGTYWTYAGVTNILGQRNLAIVSNLDNELTTENLTRIAADGTTADAYTNFRAENGDVKYVTPIESTSTSFELIQHVTNLYAAYLLVRHRVFNSTDQAVQQQVMIDLKGEAMDLYAELFGAATPGIDGEAEEDTTPQPGTFVNVTMTFEPEATVDENTGRTYF